MSQEVLVEKGSKVHQIYQLVNEIESEEELRLVYQIYRSAIDRIRDKKAMHTKITCPIGAKVYWDSQRHNCRFVGRLTEKKRTRGVVSVDGQLWTVPLSMLKRADVFEGEKE